MNLYEFLRKTNAGGCIVSASSCTAEQIAAARATNNVWADGEGMAFVYLPSLPRASSGLGVGFGSGINPPAKIFLQSGQEVDKGKLNALAEFVGCDPGEIVHIRHAKSGAGE